MQFSEEFATLAAAVVGASLGAIATYVFRRKFERFKATIDLFRSYNSPEMIQARHETWQFLLKEYPTDPRPFHELFADRGSDWTHRYGPLIKIVYFWYLLSVLKEEREIVPRLARQVFAYQFQHWEAALRPLYEASKSGADQPEWLMIFEPGRMDWLR